MDEIYIKAAMPRLLSILILILRSPSEPYLARRHLQVATGCFFFSTSYYSALFEADLLQFQLSQFPLSCGVLRSTAEVDAGNPCLISLSSLQGFLKPSADSTIPWASCTGNQVPSLVYIPSSMASSYLQRLLMPNCFPERSELH